MPDQQVFQILGVAGALLLLETIIMLAARQMRSLVRMYAVHSLLLAACAAIVGYYTGTYHLYLVAGLTLLFKTIAIPYALERVIHNTLLEKREINFIFGVPFTLIAGGLLSLLAYLTSVKLVYPGDTLAGLLLPVGTAIALLGLFIMIGRMEAVPQITGLLVMENGIILIAVVTAFSLPLVAEFGLFLDILVGTLLLGILVMRLQRDAGTTASGKLRRLVG